MHQPHSNTPVATWIEESTNFIATHTYLETAGTLARVSETIEQFDAGYNHSVDRDMLRRNLANL